LSEALSIFRSREKFVLVSILDQDSEVAVYFEIYRSMAVYKCGFAFHD